MNKYFNLSNTLAKNSNGDPKDTLKVKQTLHKLGYMEEPSYGIDDMPDKPLFDGIKDFQIDKGLKADGVMKPGGETEDAFNKIIKGEKPKSKKPVSKKEAEPIKTGKVIDFPDVKDKSKPDHPIIKNSVGIGKVNDPEDVQLISEYLNEILGKQGEGKPSPTTANSDFLFDIQKFQKEKDLKIDGVIEPDGVTENALKEETSKEDGNVTEQSEVCQKLNDKHNDVIADLDRANQTILDFKPWVTGALNTIITALGEAVDHPDYKLVQATIKGLSIASAVMPPINSSFYKWNFLVI